MGREPRRSLGGKRPPEGGGPGLGAEEKPEPLLSGTRPWARPTWKEPPAPGDWEEGGGSLPELSDRDRPAVQRRPEAHGEPGERGQCSPETGLERKSPAAAPGARWASGFISEDERDELMS